MRYVPFAGFGFLAVNLCGSVFGYATIAGLVPDLILILAIAIMFNEHSLMPIIFAAVFGFIYDDLFSPVLGGNALAYTVSIILLYIALRKSERIRFWMPALAGFGCYIVKELILAIIVFALGRQFDLLYMMLRFILPGAGLTAGIMIPMYYLFKKLYTVSWIRPRRKYADDMEMEI